MQTVQVEGSEVLQIAQLESAQATQRPSMARRGGGHTSRHDLLWRKYPVLQDMQSVEAFVVQSRHLELQAEQETPFKSELV